MNIDEIISGNNSKTFDKTLWAKKQQERRKKTYELIDKTVNDIINDKQKFQKYLDVQSKFNVYSVANALLITAQKPTATQIKSFADWKKLGNVFKGYTRITILEPGSEYEKPDGSVGVYYNPKDMIDVSDTSVRVYNDKVNFDDSIKLKSLFYDCPITIRAVDDIKGYDNLAKWDSVENILYVKRNSNVQKTFQEFSREISLASFDNIEDYDLAKFKSECVSYMICKKHDIPLPAISEIPDSLKNMEMFDVRKELNSMKQVMDDINSRMNTLYEKVLNQFEKENNRTTYER